MNADQVRVVVVDDLEDAAATLAYALERDGYHVRIAHDGVQALAVIDEFKPHCVLFDIDMPRLDGFELSKQLRTLYRDDIVLIAITAAASHDTRVAGAFTVADHYYRKPVDPAALRQLLPPLGR
jgi:DNA-binding response OmpR family regulator